MTNELYLKTWGMGKRKDIKVLFCDVDGTLTDGKLYYGPEGELLKAFHVHDGHGIKEWIKKGGVFVIVSSRESLALARRFQELAVGEVYQAVQDKAVFVKNWLKEHGYSTKEAAYIGDDVNDLEAMRIVGISACPANAVSQVKEEVDYVCDQNGGEGALREFVDYLLKKR